MRFTIILALCFVGVVSASSLNKRSFVDDFQNNTQNAFKAFEQFGQSFNDKLQEALKNLMNAFGQKQQSEAPVSVSKRDLQENIKKFTEEAKKNAENALKQLFNLLQSLKPKPSEATTEAAVEKRDVQAELKELSENAKINAERSVGELVKFFEKFQAQINGNTGASKTVSKRDIQETIEKFNKLAQTKAQEAFKNIQQALEKLLHASPFFQSVPDQIAEDSTEKSVSKRDVFDSFEKFSKNAYEKFMSTFEHLFNKLGGDEEDIAFEDQATESYY